MALRETDRPLFISLGAVVVVFVVVTAYLFTAVLQVPLLSRPVTVTVDLERTGGLYEGSSVTYRGAKAGVVETIELTSEGTARARVRLAPGVEIPQDSPAEVRSLSPVGEQYLDFQPTTASGPFLRDGSRVRAEAVDVPTTLASTVVSLEKLMDQIDPDQVHDVITGLRATFAGREDDLADLVEGSQVLLVTLDEEWPTISRVLVNSESLLRLGERHSSDVRAAAHDLALLTTELEKADPELRRAFDRGPEQFADLVRLVGVLDRTLPPTLERSTALTDILVVRDPHLRELLAEYPDAIRSLADAMYDGAIHGGLVLQNDYQCDYGGPKYPATDTTPEALYQDGHCSAPPDRVVRGAENAPDSTG
jgi:virulence factor Mce-like protein